MRNRRRAQVNVKKEKEERELGQSERHVPHEKEVCVDLESKDHKGHSKAKVACLWRRSGAVIATHASHAMSLIKQVAEEAHIYGHSVYKSISRRLITLAAYSANLFYIRGGAAKQSTSAHTHTRRTP